MSSRTGRPIMGEEPKNKQVALRVTETTKRKFQECSILSGKTQTNLLEEMVDNLYNELKEKERLKMKEEKFIEINLKSKISFIQEEHNYVMKVLYDNACEVGAVVNDEFSESISQSFSYTKIKEKTSKTMSDKVLQICLRDLESMDFLINTMRNPYKETEYGIRPLGLEYIKSCSREE